MTQIDYYWSFVCQNREQYLDCELLTASCTYFTNQCFLQSSSLLKTFAGTEYLIISMPEYSYSDVNRELNGYFTMEKQNLTQGKLPTLKTMELGHLDDQVLKSCKLFVDGSDMNSPCSKKTEQEENKKKRQLKIKSSEVKSPRADQKSFQCDACGLIFLSSKKCRQHKYQVHNTKSFGCKLCCAVFKTQSILGKSRQKSLKFIGTNSLLDQEY